MENISALNLNINELSLFNDELKSACTEVVGLGRTMDITLLFKASVKTIRTRNKAFGVNLPESDKNRILTSRNINHTDFTIKAKEVLNLITRLRDFLLEHRKAYLNFSGHLSTLPKLSDHERDKIDTGAQRIMKNCSQQITEFRRDASVSDGQPQVIEHQNAVVDLLEDYLKTVCKIYSDQKATRMKRNLELQKMSRLESEILTNDTKFSSQIDLNLLVGQSPNRTEMYSEDLNISSANFNDECASFSLLSQQDDLSAEELQMFESENEQMYNELNSLVDEVKQIKTKVFEIAELQEMFTEKVLVQEKDIERIYGTVVGTTEHVQAANVQIRHAIRNNSSFRMFVIFFLLVMTLTLIFLDWYND